jgi:hypothetical protein
MPSRSAASRTPTPRRAIAEVPLPFYVQPAADEALISWLGRLAGRFDLSPHEFASHAFGVDNRGPAQLRPSPLSLKRISEVTGVPVDHLDRMTLNSWSPSYRRDEADGGYWEIRYRNPPRERSTRYVASRSRNSGYRPLTRSERWTVWSSMGWMRRFRAVSGSC